MATRIRYANNNGTLVSKPMMSPAGELVVNIKLDGTFTINKTDGTSAHSQTDGSDLAKAKKLAKEALKSLGVTFESEVRPRLVKANLGTNASQKHPFEDETTKGQ